jgi:superfamily II DNA/RNA helicase
MRIASLLRQVARRPLVAQQPRIVGSGRLTLTLARSFQHWNNNDNTIRRFSTDLPARVRFEDIDIHPKSLKALRRRDLLHMTEIQEKTFEACVQGKDVLGRARTGTGKTVAFLLPGIERILRNPIDDQVNMLVLSPTRELAAQIAEQAQMLVGVHGNAVTAQVIYGGSSKRDDIQRFEKKIPNILVAVS